MSRIVLLLSLTVGLPFFVLSTTGPLLQKWYSRTFHGRSPYRLSRPLERGLALGAGYVSDGLRMGFLTSVLTHALVVELRPLRPALCDLHLECGQTRQAGGTGAGPAGESVAAKTSRSTGPGRHESLVVPLGDGPFGAALGDDEPGLPGRRQRPFLWIAPLMLYLLTFIICFESDRWYRRRWAMPLAILGWRLFTAYQRREQFARGAGGRLLCGVACRLFVTASSRPEAPGARTHTVLLADCRGGRGGGILSRRLLPCFLPTTWSCTWVFSRAEP